ncbi:alanine--tRNA ligase [Ignavigranum ruoffiae]|uniref:alanine--tRNA ligase n=1 Tax=Ignavigranum ruoffiae TaxID=89093 RepID=UPI0023541834|nr:alanine--tRNA ligase [Ignavigranum ruoffiae]
MKKLTSAQIRDLWLKFFESKGHEVRPSASLIPINDPTLLWINSGVATLKKYFDGSEVPENPRITNSQKSIRTNDIENVGVTARHHTLFEMLGNFSVGDYFKEEAIPWAWEFLTGKEWLAFEPERLYVTYYPEDVETKALWEAIEGFDPSHLVPVEDNFWDIGAGPCGPDTEIFYDRGAKYSNLAEEDPENYPGGENERWLEIWNLVFSEFNHMPDDTYQPLPHKNVDTGAGLERLTSVIQDTPTNFETDLFMPIIQALESMADHHQYAEASEKIKTSFKVIADHIRAVAFAISDGALPSNEGRGYIIRRLIRRSVMHGRRLGIQGLFLAKLVPVISDIMGSYYQELHDKIEFVQEVLTSEEERFHETIEEGEMQLEELMTELKENGIQEIPGDQAFTLYDTFGFPLELTQEMAVDHGFTVDVEGFEAEMEQQRERARNARSQESSMNIQSAILTEIDSDFDFVGYHQLETDASILYIIQEDQLLDKYEGPQGAWLVFNRSPFYAEMGGQIADQGGLYDGFDLIASIKDVKKMPNGQFMHKVEETSMPLLKNQSYTLRVDPTARQKTNQNHTATHLLHQGLKRILGPHANQAGSYVGPDRLRFDFSHFGKVTKEELDAISEYVNQMINQAIPVDISEMPIDEAKALGAMALFGEKYGDIVRVVNIGGESIELCGGTHVNNTQQIATFKILSESGIGAGIRRIEALTGQAAIDYYRAEEAILEQIQEQLKVGQTDQILYRLSQLQEQIKDQDHEIQSLMAKLLQQESNKIFDQVETVGELTYIAARVDNQSSESLRNLGDQWRPKNVSNLLILVSNNEGKVVLNVFADDMAIDQGVKAGDLIKPLAKMVGGGGGGRPQMAQAGGKSPEKIDSMLDQVAETIASFTEE